MLSSSRFSWWRLELIIPFELEESFAWKCEELGVTSFAIKYEPENKYLRTLFVWLAATEWNYSDRDKFVLGLLSLDETFGLCISKPIWEEVDDEDWSNSWKRHWQADPVATRLLILPAWLKTPEIYSDRVIVRLDPGRAFGCGSHPSTRLCLEALDRSPPVGMTVADLGCGSGILSFAALGLGAKQVFAVDTDSLAVRSTIDNSKLNDLEEGFLKVFEGSVDVLEAHVKTVPVDFLICNILADVIEGLAPSFSRLLHVNGKCILSGILVSQVPKLSSSLGSLGWGLVDSYEKDQWALLEIRKKQNSI